MRKQSINELAIEVVKGNKFLVDVLLVKSRGFINNIAGKFFRDQDDRADVVCEVSMKVYRNFSKYDENRGVFESWLRRLTENHCLDRLRKKQRSPEVLEEDVVFDSFCSRSAEEEEKLIFRSLDCKVYRNFLGSLLGNLSELQREVIRLKYYEDMENEEISKVLNLTPNNIRVLHFRALDVLRRMVNAA